MLFAALHPFLKPGRGHQKQKRMVQFTFLYMKHKTCFLSRRNGLPKGIFVEDAQPELIQKRQLVLRPILRLAKKQAEYKRKCKLDNNYLIIGNKYSIETLNRLPADLAPYKVAQLSSDTCLVFHGQHTPLSNFHISPFTLDNHQFHSAEQYIQYKKACHFTDYTSAEKILQCKDPYGAKTLSCNIPNFDKNAWKSVARDACLPGI